MDKYIKTFVDTINDYIIVNNTTATGFAKKIGCRDCCVSRWLDGTNTPSLEYVILVADFLNCTVDYLLGLSDSEMFVASEKQTTFAKRFIALQKDSGKSLNQIAKLCGVSSSNVSKWLLRGQLPKPQTVCLLAELFGCSVDYLIGRIS